MPEPTEIRIQIASPRAPQPEGVSVVDVELGSFFTLLGRIGNDPGLLLLTVRALRQRATYGGMRLTDLAWVLRASERSLSRWFERLSNEGLVVYQIQSAVGVDVFVIEIVDDDTPPPRPTGDAVLPSVRHALPTHWFAHVLPRLGRVTFLAYLYLLARESEGSSATLDLQHMARALRLWGARRARHHVLRLHRHGLVKKHPRAGLMLNDPPPLTKAQRLHLRLLASGVLTHLRRDLAILAAALLLGASILFLAHR